MAKGQQDKDTLELAIMGKQENLLTKEVTAQETDQLIRVALHDYREELDKQLDLQEKQLKQTEEELGKVQIKARADLGKSQIVKQLALYRESLQATTTRDLSNVLGFPIDLKFKSDDQTRDRIAAMIYAISVNDNTANRQEFLKFFGVKSGPKEEALQKCGLSDEKLSTIKELQHEKRKALAETIAVCRRTISALIRERNTLERRAEDLQVRLAKEQLKNSNSGTERLSAFGNLLGKQLKDILNKAAAAK